MVTKKKKRYSSGYTRWWALALKVPPHGSQSQFQGLRTIYYEILHCFRASSHCSYSDLRHCRFMLAFTHDIHLTDTQSKPTGTHAYTACGNLQVSSGFKETIQRTKMTRTWYRKDRKTQVNTEELRVFLRIETKNTFSNWFKFLLSEGEKKSKYIKLTNYSLKVQFPFQITNKQQQ